MSEETGMYMDTKEFAKDLLKITEKEIPGDIIKAYWELGWLIIGDAIKIEPTVPMKSSDLRGSGKVVVDEKKLEMKSGFNMIYAHRLHEAPDSRFNPTEGEEDWNWTTSGSGPKYLESKIAMFKNKYIKFIADRIRG